MSFATAVALQPVQPSTPRSSVGFAHSRSGVDTPWTHTTVVGHSNAHTPQPSIAKDLPRPPSILQPLRKHETTGQRAPPPRRRREIPPQRLGWAVVFPGFVVVLLSAGLATCLLLYLAIRRERDAPSFLHGFYVDEINGGEAHLYGLVVSTIITNVVWHVGFPVLLGMSAYCIAGLWLSHQQYPRSEQPNLLTPLQYGLLFKLFSVPGPAPVYQAGTYLANRRARVPTPSFLTTAVVLVGGVLLITYLISAADIWLQAASAVVILAMPVPGPASPEDPPSTSPPPPPPPLPPLLRGHYPLAPVVAYLTLLYLHALLTAFITIWAALLRSPVLRSAPTPEPDPESNQGSVPTRTPAAVASTSSTVTWPPAPTALRLAHLHLTDALAPIAARLSSRIAPIGLGAGEAYGRAMFVEDLNTARVEVGVWASEGGGGRRRWGDTTGDRVFGVYKKVVPWKGEIY